jgi:hypothetical protein
MTQANNPTDPIALSATAGSDERKAALAKMSANDTPLTRVEYLIASIDNVHEKLYERGVDGALAPLDNLRRIATDVRLSIIQNVERRHGPDA